MLSLVLPFVDPFVRLSLTRRYLLSICAHESNRRSVRDTLLVDILYLSVISIDGDDIGTAVGVVPVFSRLPELEEPLLHTHYELHRTHLPILQQNALFFLEFFRGSCLDAKIDFFAFFAFFRI